MTHIVYHKGIFFADRKCYGSSGVVLQQRKIRTATHGDELWVWAFSGEYAACEYGDAVLQSNLDETVVKEAKETLGLNVANEFAGLLVIKNNRTKEHKVYLVNYFGLRMQVDETEDLICVGALSGEIQRAYRLLRTASANVGIPLPHLCGFKLDDPRSFYRTGDEIEWLIKHVTHNTDMGQDGFYLDRYDFKESS